MDFRLTEEQEILKKTVSNFMQKECPRDYIRECEEKEVYPEELFRKMTDLGWLGLRVPTKYGGSETGAIELAIFLEEVARGMLSAAQIYYSLYLIGVHYINSFGTEEQRDYYLPLLVNNKIRFAFALTEPNAGSDAASLTTSAFLDGDEFIVNGQKTFITGAKTSDVILVMVRTDKAVEKHQGISMLLMDSTSPGITYRELKKLGLKPVDLYEVFLDDVKVSRKNLLGQLNKGWDQVREVLDHERFCLAAMNVGGAQAVLEDAVQYAKERYQFGQPIGKFQMTKEKLADMQLEVDAARLLTLRTAWMVEEGIPCTRESSMAKLFASETYMRAALKGLQIMGGYGYMMEYDMQRHFRDAKISEIGGGSSEIQRLIIAKSLGL